MNAGSIEIPSTSWDQNTLGVTAIPELPTFR
jgi:hypothetical protein